MDRNATLTATANLLARRGRGILAADESVGTIGKRLLAHGLENNSENRRAFRELLVCAPDIENALSGFIMFDETFYQSTQSGERFLSVLERKGILPGIKVDTGLKPLEDTDGESFTSGIETLVQRCTKYYEDGAKFAKWRAALKIDKQKGLPSHRAIRTNAHLLAQYAKIAQDAGLVPIVEPEILIDGNHTQEESANTARLVIRECYIALREHSVLLEGSLLKPMMIMPGKDHPDKNTITPHQIAEVTLQVMREVVPPEVPGIMFLSGGMSEIQATVNLSALNKLADSTEAPWTLSFSYGRALQSSPLKTWAADKGKKEQASKIAGELALANAKAQLGLFDGAHPSVIEEGALYEGFRGWRTGEDPKGT